jgi:predicted RNase H-like HicB family nuclease
MPLEGDHPVGAGRSLVVRCFRERLARRSVPRCRYERVSVVTRVVHVPYVVEQDEDGVWCASAQLRPGVGAVGDGPTAEAAVADLRDALAALLAEVGPPDELTLTLDVA